MPDGTVVTENEGALLEFQLILQTTTTTTTDKQIPIPTNKHTLSLTQPKEIVIMSRASPNLAWPDSLSLLEQCHMRDKGKNPLEFILILTHSPPRRLHQSITQCNALSFPIR